MKFISHNYQLHCIEYIKTHPVSVLFLDMGLGKTVITLTALKELNLSKVLIIAPLRPAISTWPDEVKKWDHLAGLTISTVTGDAKHRIAALEADADLYTINRENIPWLVEYCHHIRWPFETVVIDELSSFKNIRAKRWKALRKVRPFVKRWIGLTGTPASNGLMDLFAEIGILDGGERLGRYIGRYREAYFRPGAMDPKTGIVFSYILREGAEELIYKRISDITISMKALDYLDMPECVYVTHEAELEGIQRRLYDTLKKELIVPLAGGDIDAANAAVLSGKLLQMANGCVYDENGQARSVHDKKLQMLEELIESANGQNVLISYWFRHDADRIRKRIEGVREIRTAEDIKDWNAGKIPIALIHPASAGHGLNLQAGGHILIWFGLTWSLELYQQTNARLWRQGQKEVVTIHHIVTKDTIDENVMLSLQNKDFTQQKLIDAVRAKLSS